MTSKENNAKRKERKHITAEIFTPNRLVCQMLAKLPQEVWKKGKTFLDPAVGNGQFLVWVLLRKIVRNNNTIDAIKSVYGVDIMKDNIKECQLRLLKVVSLFEDISEDHIKAVLTNIVWINPDKHPSGSLEYNFEFNNKPTQEDVNKWMKWVKEGHKLDNVDLPINEDKFVKMGQIDMFEEFP